jgi:Cupredoxin-like domain
MVASRPSRLALLAVASALLVGCGHAKVVGGDRSVNMALSDYRLNPSTVHASPGVVTFFVHNYGRLTHDLVISQDGRTAGQIKPIAPGQSAQLALDLAPGTYSMTSTILSDQALGAYGTLKVSG